MRMEQNRPQFLSQKTASGGLAACLAGIRDEHKTQMTFMISSVRILPPLITTVVGSLHWKASSRLAAQETSRLPQEK
jgi:hypothetical protein